MRHDVESCCCPDCCLLRQAREERDKARAALSALDAHWLAKFQAETTRASQLEATVRGLEFEVEWLRKRLGDKAQLSSEKLSAAFTEGTLAAGDAMRDHLRTVAERQREADRKAFAAWLREVHATGLPHETPEALADAVDAGEATSPLVTEGIP